MQPGDKIALYRSLFRGRNDIFARRSATANAYFPEYVLDWNEFNAHKASGGKMADFKNKTPAPLTDQVILKHLSGVVTLGIYPILEGNASYFLAADFDKADWLEDCKNYQAGMDNIGLTTYIERSRSGNGGHVWAFFEEAYPCHKSRTIGLEAVRKVLNLSAFDKEASFDRLFPNQDSISRAGFGNLIALPFQGSAVRDGNTVFIDPETNEPYEDQFTVLSGIKRHSLAELDEAYNKSTNIVDPELARSKKLRIKVDQNITLENAI